MARGHWCNVNFEQMGQGREYCKNLCAVYLEDLMYLLRMKFCLLLLMVINLLSCSSLYVMVVEFNFL